MRIRCSALVVFALACPPALSHAESGHQLMDACVNAFIAEHLPDRKAQVKKRHARAGSILIALERPTVVELTAVGKTSGELIAKASCTATADGLVTVTPMAVKGAFAQR